MGTIYDDVAADARADHRHNPPGYATRPIGHRTIERAELEGDEYWQDRGTGAFDPREDRGEHEADRLADAEADRDFDLDRAS